MKLEKIKKIMIKWRDFYGQDICAVDEIVNATSKEELLRIINKHIEFIQDQNIDAISHAEEFRRSLKLE
jgi:hypothetical protein